MTWATISGAGTTTATKFHGDVMNKINNMLGGTDVSDSVTINSAVLWTMGNQTMTGRFQTDKGADVASPAGGIMTLGTDGNVFDVTGTNTINEILGTTWTLGAQIVLQFDGVLTVTHNSGGTNDILLGNATNMTTAAGNTLSLFYNGTDWVETARNVGDGAGDALTSNGLDQFAATTSAELLSTISDETGTGLLVFATSPTLTTPVLGTPASGTLTSCTGLPAAGVVGTAAVLGANTFTGDQDLGGNDLDNVQRVIRDISTSGTDIDFSEDELQTISIAAATTFTGTNYAAGISKTVYITTDGTLRTLAFPANWKFMGTKPTDQAASKVGVLTLDSTTAADTGVRCAYAVEA
jgi:hypothetical protein